MAAKIRNVDEGSTTVERISIFATNMLFQRTTLNCKGHLVSLERPQVMGILNTTPDSFYDGGQYPKLSAQLNQVERMVKEGARFIDIGGMSSRPGAELISTDEELKRVIPIIKAVAERFPDVLMSIDTVHAVVAKEAVMAGAAMINDISAGSIDPEMYNTVAQLQVPYILMHMQGQPNQMQKAPSYQDVVLEILDFFIAEIGKLRALHIKDLIIDPGFGFGKSMDHNYQILKRLEVFKMLEVPMLAGLSRKSMIYKALNVQPDEALNGSTAMHIVALQQGVKILRVHDVKEAAQCIELFERLNRAD